MGRKHEISELIALQLAEFKSETDRAPHVDPPVPKAPSYSATSVLKRIKNNVWFAAASASTLTLVATTIVAGLLFFNTRSADVDKADRNNTYIEAALRADQKIESLSAEEKPTAIAASCKSLANAIARMSDKNPNDLRRCRRLLIQRLIELKEPRFTEAERQIVLLDAAPSDPQCVRWMAMTLVGQVNHGTYKQRNAHKYEQDRSYWHWLSCQPLGEVLFDALDHFPTDIHLIANLVELADESPESFSFGTQSGGNGQRHSQKQLSLRRRVEQRVARINHDESSHSLLVRHRFESANDSDKALELLRRGAERSERRLLLLGDTAAPRDLAPTPLFDLSAEQPVLFRDFLLLLEVAQGLHEVEPQLAQRYYDCLMSLRREAFPIASIEKAHLLSGQLAFEQGQPARAVKTWRQGIERVGGNSLDLYGAIATLAHTFDTNLFQQDRNSILNEYQAAIEANSTRLTNASEGDFTLAQRKELGRQIRTAKWRYLIAESHLLSTTDSIGAAIEQLRIALTQSVDVQPIAEQRACVQLAEWYLAEGATDSAAEYFERAISLDPSSTQLRQRAAEAWSRAGNPLRAATHRQRDNSDHSLHLKLVSLEDQFQQTLSQHSSSPDFEGFQRKIRSLQREVCAQRSDIQISGELRKYFSRLEVMQICLPPKGESIDQHLASIHFQSQLANIAREYRDVESTQRFAAAYLTSLGANKDATLALNALRQLHGADSPAVAITRARKAAAIAQPIEASKILLSCEGDSEAETRFLLLMAANFAMRANDIELGYIALNRINSSHRTCHDLFTLAKLSKQLPAESEALNRGLISADEVSANWKNELSKRERNSCGFTNYLNANAVITELAKRNDKIQANDPQLVEAKRLIRDLLAKRPNWSEAVLLASEVAAIEGSQQQAIRMLRDTIMAGAINPKLLKQLDVLLAASQTPANQWASLASSTRVIETVSLNSSVHVQRLLSAHRSIDSADIYLLPNSDSHFSDNLSQ